MDGDLILIVKYIYIKNILMDLLAFLRENLYMSFGGVIGLREIF